MAHHTPVAPIAQVLIPSDPDLGRLAHVRPAAVERVRRQMVGDLWPLTIDRLMLSIGIEPPAPRNLIFDPGTGIYTITIVPAPLIGYEGQELIGRCVWSNRQIHISSIAPRHQRLEVLAHECLHAYWYAHGRSYDEEVICDQFGACALMLFRQLLAQGGEPALMAMEPIDPDDAIEHSERFDGCY